MTSMNAHRRFSTGPMRPGWAGAVQSTSSRRTSGPNRVVHSTEFSGLVLPVSVPPAADPHTFGQGLGFPHLGDHMPDVHPELWKNWARFERVLSQAAAGAMGWNGPLRQHHASAAAVPRHALHLVASRQVMKSKDQSGPPRSDAITGEIRKMFAIRDVSGTQLRFESAGTSAHFRVTSAGVHWSRDPRGL